MRCVKLARMCVRQLMPVESARQMTTGCAPLANAAGSHSCVIKECDIERWNVQRSPKPV